MGRDQVGSGHAAFHEAPPHPSLFPDGGEGELRAALARRAKDPVNLSYRIGWTFFRIVYAILFRWRAYNPENVPLEGPVILACNHASFIDPPLVGGGLKRPLNYLARESLFRFPVAGAILRSWQAIPVDRDGGGGAGLRAILDRLLAGGAILLFPEGTRTRDGKLQPGHAGIGLAVIKSNAPVIPVRVFGTFEAFGRYMRFPRPHRIAVKYGRPMLFAELRAEAKTCSKPRLKQIYLQISDEIMKAIAALEISGGK
jgi:1-acyl-sn-glycerol-3-phosphate acyltransferase